MPVIRHASATRLNGFFYRARQPSLE
jgi:hypothetical protein